MSQTLRRRRRQNGAKNIFLITPRLRASLPPRSLVFSSSRPAAATSRRRRLNIYRIRNYISACNAAGLFSRRQIRYSIEGSSISVMLAFKKN